MVMKPGNLHYRRDCDTCTPDTPIKKLCRECYTYYNSEMRRASNNQRLRGAKSVNYTLHWQDYNMTLKEIAEEEGVTRERIRQIEREALAKLARSPELKAMVTHDGLTDQASFFAKTYPHLYTDEGEDDE